MSKPRIKICIGSSCFSRGNAQNVEIVEKFLADHNLKDDVDVDLEGCLCTGKCPDGPIVVVDDHVYTRVSGGAIRELLKKTFPGV